MVHGVVRTLEHLEHGDPIFGVGAGHIDLNGAAPRADIAKGIQFPPPPVIDTSRLSVAPPRTGSLEDCRQDKPARPIGDISHLALSDD